MRREIRGLALGASLFLLAAGAGAQQMYKCGATYQDRPCAELEVQKRYAPGVGRFDVDQANADTDRDCARLVSQLMPYWSRVHSGEALDTIRAEYEARPIARAEKSQMRDLLLAMREIGGTPVQARSQLETQCMAYKRRRGMPTDRDLESARSGTTTNTVPTPSSTLDAASARALAEQRRAEAAAARAAAVARRGQLQR